ncbi:MAG: alkane 1-monooxygenase, partial [Rhodococcus sp. (in: high G+C Gram-positive bacteria)]
MGLIPPTAIFMALGMIWAFNQLGWNAVSPIWWWIGPMLVYGLLPVLDLIFAPDGQNPPDEVMERLENDKYYRYCTY